MVGRRFIRWFATAVMAGLVLAIVFGVVGEFFIELARERGYYDNPSERMDTVMTAISAFVTRTWFLVLTGAVAGFAGGGWLDTVLRRKDTPVDRVELADRADAIAAKAFRIYGQWEADHSRAWEDDSSDDRFNNKTLVVKERYIARFADEILPEAWQVISEAKKYISLDRSDLWKIEHGVSHKQSLHDMVVLLQGIGATLRTGREDLPLRDKIRDERERERSKLDEGPLPAMGGETLVSPMKALTPLSPRDAERKIEAIDEALEIIGYDQKLTGAIADWQKAVGNWDRGLDEEEYKTLNWSRQAVRDALENVFREIEALQRKNEKYPDIQAILSFTSDTDYIYPVSEFIDMHKRLGPNASANHRQLFAPFAEKCRQNITNLETARDAAAKELVSMRQALSSQREQARPPTR